MLVTPYLIVSEPHIIVPQGYWRPLLGELLHQAGLISLPQLQTVLIDKKHFPRKRLGNLLVSRGWVKPKTVDFFAEQWPSCLNKIQKAKIGSYLKQADLLNEEQIYDILIKQKTLDFNLKFGETAVLQGYLKPKTVEFFLKHLFPEHQDFFPSLKNEENLPQEHPKEQSLESLVEEMLQELEKSP